MSGKPFWKQGHKHCNVHITIPWQQRLKLEEIRKEYGISIGEQIRALIAFGLRRQPVKKVKPSVETLQNLSH